MMVSFVVPVYNVEKYLRQCVESILCQTYSDLEIILVDDGSTDNSPLLCDQMAEEYNRIKVIHKPNGGLSDARNAGVAIAKGEYIVFVDSDDFWLSKEGLQQLMKEAKTHGECDFIGFNCSYYYPSTGNYFKWTPYTEALEYPLNGSEALKLLNTSGTIPMSACLKLISRRFLVENKLFFKIGQIGEDTPWFINVLDKCNKCMFVNLYIYSYRQNVSGSITNSRGERSFNSLLDIVQEELHLIDNRSFSSEAKDALRSFLAYEVSILMASINKLPESKRWNARKDLRDLTWLFNYKQNPKVRMVNKVYRLFGFRITEFVLRAYNSYRTSKN